MIPNLPSREAQVRPPSIGSTGFGHDNACIDSVLESDSPGILARKRSPWTSTMRARMRLSPALPSNDDTGTKPTQSPNSEATRTNRSSENGPGLTSHGSHVYAPPATDKSYLLPRLRRRYCTRPSHRDATSLRYGDDKRSYHPPSGNGVQTESLESLRPRGRALMLLSAAPTRETSPRERPRRRRNSTLLRADELPPDPRADFGV